MAFYGCEFIFDGVSCSQYGLKVYDFGGTGQSDVTMQSGDIVEDRIARRYDALTYGLTQNKALNFSLVFGPNEESLDAASPMDRYDIQRISSWLTGHKERKWLSIVQPDMHG